MSEPKHKGSWYPLTGQGVQWDSAGKPYYNTSDGLKDYIPPIAAAQYSDDPKMLQWAADKGAKLNADGSLTNTSTKQGGLIHGASQWDSQTGDYHQPINWGNIMALGVGGAIAAPFAVGALGSLAAGSAPVVGTGVPAAIAPEIATTAGIGSATSLGLPATVGLGSAGGAAAAGGTAAGVTAATLPEAAAPAAAPGAVLPSTQIGTGAVGPIAGGAGTPGLTAAARAAQTAGGGGVDWLKLATSDQTIGTLGQLAGGFLNNKAAQNAADQQAAAYKYAADLQDAANKRAEQFLREQAENQFANSEATRKGNYDQWRARENRFSGLSEALGAGARQIPDYVAGVDPRYTTSSQQTYTGDKLPGGTSTDGGGPTSSPQVQPTGAIYGSEGPGGITGRGTGGVILGPDGKPAQPQSAGLTPKSDDPVTQAVFDNYSALGKAPTGEGTGPTDYAYFVKRINETGGLTDANKSYWFGPNGRIAKELAGAVPAEGSKSTQQLGASSGPQGYQYTPTMTTPMTQALGATPTPQLTMPGSLAALAQQQKWFY